MYYLTLTSNGLEKKWGIKCCYFGVVANQSIYLINNLEALCMSIYSVLARLRIHCIVSNDSAKGFCWLIQERLHSNHSIFFFSKSQVSRPHPPISKGNNNGQSILDKYKPSIIPWMDGGNALQPDAVPCCVFSCISLIREDPIQNSAQLHFTSRFSVKKKGKAELEYLKDDVSKGLVFYISNAHF